MLLLLLYPTYLEGGVKLQPWSSFMPTSMPAPAVMRRTLCPQQNPVPLHQNQSGQLGLQAPAGEANRATVAAETDQHIPRLKKAQILQRLGQSRALCEAQWTEAGSTLVTASRDKARCVNGVLTTLLLRAFSVVVVSGCFRLFSSPLRVVCDR